MKYAGFKMGNKYCFYTWSERNKAKVLTYWSKTSLISNIKSGMIK